MQQAECQVGIASTNDKVVAIDETNTQLQENDQVVLNPRQHMGKFDFSEFPLSAAGEQVARTTESTRNAVFSVGEAAADVSPSHRTELRGSEDPTATQETALPARKPTI